MHPMGSFKGSFNGSRVYRVYGFHQGVRLEVRCWSPSDIHLFGHSGLELAEPQSGWLTCPNWFATQHTELTLVVMATTRVWFTAS